MSQQLARSIVPTSAELAASRYDSPNIQAALEALHQDGFVVLKSVVDVTHLDHLYKFMSIEADDLVKNKRKPFNQGVNCELFPVVVDINVRNLIDKANILQAPPLTDAEYLHDDIYFNPFTIQVINAYLGANPSWGFVTGNNALPKTHGLRQPVHKDITFFHPQCPFYVIANIPLCPFNPTTGSTEFWLGSHAHTSGTDQVIVEPGMTLANAKLKIGKPNTFVRPEVVEERRKICPPIQPACDKGDVMLRDLRTWHAGMPNESDDYRIMLALGYQAAWYPNYRLRSKLPVGQTNFFMKHGGQPVEVRADFLPDDSEFGLLNDDFSFRPS